MRIYKITLIDLPKTSLNKFYSGGHWIIRKKIKDNFKLVIKSQYTNVFPKDQQYKVRYDFEFKSRPLDVSNCVGGMVKIIEDTIFEDDSPKTILEITSTSRKGKYDLVYITISELDAEQGKLL